MADNLQVVLSPALLPLYDLKDKVVVIVDILRASTSICVALDTGAKRILPVSTPKEALLFRDFDFLCAAERDAVKVEGFDMGNSPFDFLNPLIKEKSIAFTTTNGTKAIKLAREMGAGEILIGSFLNLTALCDHLIRIKKPVIILCAGWKDKFSLEDTLFAGAVVNRIKATREMDSDAALAAETLYESKKDDLENFVRQSSHAKRFKLLHLEHDDVNFCLQQDTMNIIPVLDGEYIVVNAEASSLRG